MNLHTQGLIDAFAHLLAQTEWRRWIIRFVVIKSKNTPSSKTHSPRYVAIGFLSPKRWAKGFAETHKLVSDKKGLLVGKTFQAKGMVVLQNRLSLITLPGFLIPTSIRELLSNTGRTGSMWVVEVYTFNAINKSGEIGHYGTFIEIAPAPRKFHPRHKLGMEAIWRKLGRSHRFHQYLASSEIPAKPHARDTLAVITARIAGWLSSLPMLYIFSALADHIMRRVNSSD